MPKIASILAHNNAFAPSVDSDTIRGGFLNVRATASGLAGEFDPDAALQADGNKQDLVKEKGTIVYVTDQTDYFILNDKSESDVAPGQPGSGWISLRSAIGAGTGSSNLALSDISVGADASASGGGGLAYDNSSGAFTYTPPDLSSLLTSSDISTFIALGDISVGADASASGSGGLAYDNGTGVFTYTPPVLSTFLTSSDISTFIALSDISVGSDASASGSGGLAYDSGTGIFTYTPPALSSFLTSSDISTFITLTGISVGADASASGSGGLSYDNSSGAFTYTPPDLSSFIALTDISVGANAAASGSGGLAYDNSSGAFTYTPPVLTSFLTSSDISTFIALDDISVGSDASASGSGGLGYASGTGIFTYTPPDLSSFLESADLSGYAQLSGATFTGAISATNLTLSGNLTVSGDFIQANSTTVNFEDAVLALGVPRDTNNAITNGTSIIDTGLNFVKTTAGGAITEFGAFRYDISLDLFKFTRHADGGDYTEGVDGVGGGADNVAALKFTKSDTGLGIDSADVTDAYASNNSAVSNQTAVRSLGAVSKCSISITTESTDGSSNFAPVTSAAAGYPIKHNLGTQSIYVVAIKTSDGNTPIFCKYVPKTDDVVQVSVGITAENETYDIIVIG